MVGFGMWGFMRVLGDFGGYKVWRCGGFEVWEA